FSDTASVIEWAAFGTARRHAAGLTYQLGRPGRWAVAIIELRGVGPRIISIVVKPMPASYNELHRFRWPPPRPAYAGLLIVSGFAFVSLATASLVLRTPMPMRWLWLSLPSSASAPSASTGRRATLF